MWATIGYNVVEAAVALSEGARASSTALIGFGLDSVVEVSAAAAVAWPFAARDPERREKAALRFVALSFFALAAYVSVGAVRALLGLSEPRHSPIGIGLAVVSLMVMPNAAFGWSWADPMAALVIAGFAVREGLEAWRGDGCCGTPAAP